MEYALSGCKEVLVRILRLLSSAFLVVPVLAALPSYAATVVYDFQTPAAGAALSGSSFAVYSSKGIPLAIEAGLFGEDGLFHRGERDAELAVVLDPPVWTLGSGLGVLSTVQSGSGPEEGLSQEEVLVFHFSSLFTPTSVHLSGFTLGGPDGGGTFEAVRVFADGEWLFDLPGSPSGELAIPLPAGISTLALTPLLGETPQIPTLSSDPVFYVASIEGIGARGVAFDLRPGSCPNPINTASRGVLPAAILGTSDLNAASIDPSSIRLAGVAPVRSGIADAGAPGAGSCGTAKPDGRADLTLKFDTEAIVQALRASLGTLRDRQQVVLPLEGRLRDGTPFQAEDVALILVPKKGKK
jgi:hypothetical protein